MGIRAWDRHVRVEIGQAKLLAASTDNPVVREKVKDFYWDTGRGGFEPGKGVVMHFEPVFSFNHYGGFDSEEYNWDMDFEVHEGGERGANASACEVSVWNPDPWTLDALKRAYEEGWVPEGKPPKGFVNREEGSVSGPFPSEDSGPSFRPTVQSGATQRGLLLKLLVGWGPEIPPVLHLGDVTSIKVKHDGSDSRVVFEVDQLQIQSWVGHHTAFPGDEKREVMKDLLFLQPLPWRGPNGTSRPEPPPLNHGLRPTYRKSKVFGGERALEDAIRQVAEDMGLMVKFNNNEIVFAFKRIKPSLIPENDGSGGSITDPAPPLWEQLFGTNPPGGEGGQAEEETSGEGGSGTDGPRFANEPRGGAIPTGLTFDLDSGLIGEPEPSYESGKDQGLIVQNEKTDRDRFQGVSTYSVKLLVNGLIHRMHGFDVLLKHHRDNQHIRLSFRATAVQHQGSTYGSDYQTMVEAELLRKTEKDAATNISPGSVGPSLNVPSFEGEGE